MKLGHRRLPLAGLGVLVIALVPALTGGWLAPRTFFASWLAAWWFVLGLMLGAMANLHLHRLTGGRWGEVLRPAGFAAARRMPVALLLGLPLAAAAAQLYPWAVDPQGWAADLAQPGFTRAWLQPGAVALRLVGYAAAWWWLSRPASTATKARAAASLALYLLTGTLASVDLLMSLVPGWYSTAFGLIVLSGQMLGGMALMTLLSARAVPQVLAATARGKPPLARDFGNLLLMWLMTWAYLAFMEFLIIWAENLPREIAWFVPRLQTAWALLGLALVIGQFALPLLALLQRPLKDRPARLAVIAGALLVTQGLNSAWLVLPSVTPPSLVSALLAPGLAVAMALLVFGGLEVTHGDA